MIEKRRGEKKMGKQEVEKCRDLPISWVYGMDPHYMMPFGLQVHRDFGCVDFLNLSGLCGDCLRS